MNQPSLRRQRRACAAPAGHKLSLQVDLYFDVQRARFPELELPAVLPQIPKGFAGRRLSVSPPQSQESAMRRGNRVRLKPHACLSAI
jgi:hypothetical protein